jgi:S-adenosylmethionine:tRNA ribosyltransferase-isomerase
VATEFYTLPPEKIAQEPPKVRGTSRLLVMHRDSRKLEDKQYADVIDYLDPGDVLVLNDTKVMPARLLTHFADGRERELMLTEKHEKQLSETQAQVVYRGKLRVGDVLRVGNEEVRVVEILEGGQAIIEANRSIIEIANEYGATPLPPYIRREANRDDAQRYQTVFAQETGSVAAPTASLNMTQELLQAIRAKGIEVVYLTLHVGRGTFLPIRSEKVDEHTMHEEYFEIPPDTLAKIRSAKKSGKRVVALGTTVTRALEYAAQDMLSSSTQAVLGEADIFIHPGYEFRVVDVLLTNFHAPESTVLQLAAAFAGEEFLKATYAHALENDYRFLSYGDSMLVL